MRARAIKCILALAILVHYATPAFSQGPQGFSYQAIIRNSDGSALSNQNVLIRLSLTDEAGTTTHYTEVHTISTSALGIVNLIVGKGSTTDNLSTVPWSNGNVWLKVEVDKTQSSGYTLMGSTRLYSVPYAFYSLNGTPGPEGQKGDKGDTGDTGNGIASVSNNGNGTYTFNFTNGSTYTTSDLTGPRGEQGMQGETGPQGIPGSKGDKGDQGIPGTGLNNKGNWLSGTTYNPGDFVFDENTAQTANSMWIVKATAPFSSTTQPRLDLGNWVEFEAPEGPQGPQGPAGPLVTGIAGQTLRHDGTTWVANSFLYNNGTQIGIGTTNPTHKLVVGVGTTNLLHPDFDFIATDNGTNAAGMGVAKDNKVGYFWNSGTDIGIDAFNYGTGTPMNLYMMGNGGRVGIGTFTPGGKLDVNQIGGASGTNTALGLRAGNTGTYFGNNQIVFGYDQSLNYAHSIRTRHNSGAGTMNAIDFYTWKFGDPVSTIGGQHTMTLENGNVGIGTTAPITKLHINTTGNPRAFRISGTASTDYTEAQFAGNGREYRIGVGGSTVTDGSANKFYLYDYNASAFRLMLDASGSLGIGTTTPSQKLHVAGGNGIINNAFIGDVGHGANWAAFSNSSSSNTSGYAMLQSADGVYTLINKKSGSGYIGFRIDNIDKMVLDNAGNVGIGTTTPGAKLDVAGNFRSSGEIISTYPNQARFVYGNYGLIHRNDGANYYMLLTNSGDQYGSWNGLRPFYIENSTGNIFMGAAALYVQHGGNVGIGTTTPAGKLSVKASSTSTDNDILFSVQDKAGNNVFIVYPDAVQVIVPTDTKSSQRGAFVVTGRGTTKVETNFVNLKKTNYFIGHNVAPSITTGSKNAIIGYEAANTLSSGNNNVVVGYLAGNKMTSGSVNVYVGYQAGKLNTTGHDNVLVGTNSGPTGTSFSYSTFLGAGAGLVNTANYNTFVGCWSGNQNTTGISNTYLGTWSGFVNSTGSYNVYIGQSAGEAATGSGNIFIGYQAGQNIDVSNKLYLDNSSTASPLIYGDFTGNRIVINGNSTNNLFNRTFFSNGSAGGTTAWSNDSDIKLKTDIQTITSAVEKVIGLRGVSYKWRDNREEGVRIGFIAQEVIKILPEVVSAGETYSMQYAPITALLVEAIKEQQNKLNEKDKEIRELKARLDAIEKFLRMNAK